VLIFAALAEHRVEVIADEGIYAAAPNTVWDEVVAEAGAMPIFVAGTGAILAAHSPAATPQRTARRSADGFVAAGNLGRVGEILPTDVPTCARADRSTNCPTA
jgi:uncharacterized membrane protein